MRSWRRLIAAAAICLVGTGCSGGHLDQQSGPYAVETGGDSVILSISAFGGLDNAYHPWRSIPPMFSLYGDGRVILSCPPSYKYAPAVMTCLNEARVSPDEIQRLMAAADQAGLLTDGALAGPQITDWDTTVFKTRVGGKSHRVEAYALDASEPTEDDTVQAARARLLTFEKKALDLSGFLGRSVETKTYAASSITVSAYSAQAPSVTPATAVRVWPVTFDPADAKGSDFKLSGEDMSTFVVAVQQATVADVWMAPSGYCQVSAHPSYPEEQNSGESTATAA